METMIGGVDGLELPGISMFASTKTSGWIGDINNVVTSLIQAAEILGFKLHVVTPKSIGVLRTLGPFLTRKMLSVQK